MPFGDNAAEDFVLGQTTAFGSRVAKEYKKSSQKKRQRDLMNYMERMGMQNRIADASNQRLTYDPNVVDEKEVRLVGGRGIKPYNAVVSKQDLLNRDWNTLKDTATFAAKDPETFGDVLKLGLMQSPVKAVGRLGEATWARGNDNYQNDLSKQFYDSYMQKDTENQQERWRDPNQKTMTGEPLYPLGTDKAKTGSYDDMMKRIEAFMMHKEILGSMESDFTSDTTFGDFADVASWFIPGPGIIGKGVKGAVKGGAAVGKGVKDMRTALAAAKASGFAGDVSSGFKMGVGAFAGMPLGTAGGGSGFRLGKNAVDEANRVRETLNRSIGDLEAELRLLNADDFAGKRRIEAQIARQREFMANDATLQQADIAPDVRNVDRKDLIGYKLVDPTNGTWGASIRKMTRNDIAKSLKATLKNGFERQKGSGMQPDELPDFKSKDWEDAVDRFIAEADADNLVRTTGPDDKAINWLSLANDHIDALKNPDKPGSNTIDNLIASYGRLNSQMGNKANR